MTHKDYTYYRGHKIEKVSGIFFYVDTNEPVYMDKNRTCGKCNIDNTKEGHDACLGTIDGQVMNACCGHGDNSCAYIQFNNGFIIKGNDVFEHINNSQDMTKDIL